MMHSALHRKLLHEFLKWIQTFSMTLDFKFFAFILTLSRDLVAFYNKKKHSLIKYNNSQKIFTFKNFEFILQNCTFKNG